MSAKFSRKASVSNPKIMIAFTFPEGIERRSWVEVQSELILQYAAMARSDSSELISSGKQQIAALVQELHDRKLEHLVERLKSDERKASKVASGKKGAEIRWGARSSDDVLKLFAALALSCDQLGKPLSGLEQWPKFYSGLDSAGLQPVEHGPSRTTDANRISWNGNPDGMTFKTFKNVLSETRKPAKK